MKFNRMLLYVLLTSTLLISVTAQGQPAPPAPKPVLGGFIDNSKPLFVNI